MDFSPQSRIVRRTPFVHMYGNGRFYGKSQISRYIFDLVNAMSMVQRRKVPCCAALCKKIRGESGSAIARAKRTARAKSVAAARRVTGRPVTVKGKRHASVRAAAASAKAGLGAFARKTAKRRRADCYLAEVEEVRSFFFSCSTLTSTFDFARLETPCFFTLTLSTTVGA